MATVYLSTYEDGSMLEDILLQITNLTPLDTPFMSSIGKTRARNTFHQWPTDTISTRNYNAIAEGSTYSFGTLQAPVRNSNQTQRFQKTWLVSNTDRAVKGAGISDMFMYQKEKAMKSLATDMEHALITQTVATGARATARQLMGALQFSTTNLTTSNLSLSETFFISQQQLSWVASGETADVVYCGAGIKKTITNFVANQTRYVRASDELLHNSIAVYEGDFGTVEVRLSRDMPSNAAASNNAALLLVRNDGYKMAVLDPVHHIPDSEVSPNISGKGGVIEGEVTLEVRKEPATCVVLGLNDK